MATRAMWKGVIVFDKVEIPVKLYAALQDRDIHFHLLHDQDMVRLQQRYANPHTNDTVSTDSLQKAVEIEKNVFVVLHDSELESLEPPASRDIKITRFVSPELIDRRWYDRPYYLGPDESDSTYFAFVKALTEEKRLGVAAWVMRKKRYIGAVVAEGDYLMLITLRYAADVISLADLPRPSGDKLNPKEQRLADQLIRSLEGEFDPQEYRDEYQSALRKLVEAKQKGRTLKLPKHKAKRKTSSLMAALQASLR